APLAAEAGRGIRGTGAVSQPVLPGGGEALNRADRAALTGAGAVTVTYSVDEDGNASLQLSSPATPATIDIAAQGAAQQIAFTIGGHDFTMGLSGLPLDGDRFTVSCHKCGVADNRN